MQLDAERAGVGQGVQLDADGGTYVGQWVKDLRHGQGRQTYPNGSTYGGSWFENKKVNWDGPVLGRQEGPRQEPKVYFNNPLALNMDTFCTFCWYAEPTQGPVAEPQAREVKRSPNKAIRNHNDFRPGSLRMSFT